MAEERKTIKQPVTKDILKKALQKLGVNGSQILEVHASLSSFDHVIGGAETVVDALMELCENGGTILMPMQTSGNSEPAEWKNPGVSPSLYRAVREAIPPYDARHSDIPFMSDINENFRHREGVVISSHPTVSYAAWGRYAKLLCNRQSLHFPLSEESPCARLYELKGHVLLMGTDFDTCTCMHLAEYRCDCRPVMVNGACVKTEEGNEWKKYLDLELDSSVFLIVRKLMQKKNMIREMMLGGSHLQLFSASQAVDEATKYLERTVVYDLYR